MNRLIDAIEWVSQWRLGQILCAPLSAFLVWWIVRRVVREGTVRDLDGLQAALRELPTVNFLADEMDLVMPDKPAFVLARDSANW